MNWQQFMEKSWPARMDQRVVVQLDGEEYPVESLDFDGETIRIRVEE